MLLRPVSLDIASSSCRAAGCCDRRILQLPRVHSVGMITAPPDWRAKDAILSVSQRRYESMRCVGVDLFLYMRFHLTRVQLGNVRESDPGGHFEGDQ